MHDKPRFAVFDIDGTLFRSSLYFEVVKQLILDGKLPESSADSINESYSHWRETSSDKAFWEYVEVIMSNHENNLPGLSPVDYEAAIAAVLEKQKEHIHLYPKRLMKTLKSQDYLLFAISGSQNEIVEAFGRYHGFDDWVGSSHERDSSGARFTGNVSVTHKDKTLLLQALVEKHDATFDGSIGIGDTQGDIKMLDMVDTPTAFNPNSRLYEYAKKNHWKLVFERKDVVVMLEYGNNTYQLVE